MLDKVKEKLSGLLYEASRKADSESYIFDQIADNLIANGVTVQEWFPANEPPKDTYEYWIAYKACGDYYYSTGYFDGKCWRSPITHRKIPVTHWKPLPQPPKGE